MATITRKKGGAYRVKTGGEGSSVDTYDEISLWTHASDVTFDDDKTLEDKIGYASGTLLAGRNQTVIYGSNIYTEGMIDIYVPDEYMRILVPESVSHSSGNPGQCTITFPTSVSLAENVEIRVRCI